MMPGKSCCVEIFIELHCMEGQRVASSSRSSFSKPWRQEKIQDAQLQKCLRREASARLAALMRAFKKGKNLLISGFADCRISTLSFEFDDVSLKIRGPEHRNSAKLQSSGSMRARATTWTTTSLTLSSKRLGSKNTRGSCRDALLRRSQGPSTYYVHTIFSAT